MEGGFFLIMASFCLRYLTDWTPFSNGFVRLRLALILFLPLVGGCHYAIKKETFYCYDETGNPLAGVLVVCTYSVSTPMTYRPAGCDYRFSDAFGRVNFDSGGIVDQLSGKERRVVSFVYSVTTHSGAFGGGALLPYDAELPAGGPDKSTVYERYPYMYFQDCRGDPVRWFISLAWLSENLTHIQERSYAYERVGVQRLEAALIPYVDEERGRFLEKYGDMLVPNDRRVDAIVERLYTLDRSGRGRWKFKDLVSALE